MPDPQIPEQNVNRPAAEPQAARIRATSAEPGVTLALGGGFSRGFAHLGVLEALEEEQIPVAAIVGTSIGGLLGAAYADGISVRDLCDLARQVRMRDFLRFQLSEKAPHGRRKDCLGKFVQDWFRAGQLEELSIPTSIVATDLDSGAPYVFEKGPIEVALRATCAFPGLVKPVEYQGRLLADGCIVAPVPTEIASTLNSGCVLGVNVASSDTTGFSRENIVRVSDSRSQESNRPALQPSWSRSADILLEPQVHHILWNDFSRVDEACAAGVEAMRRALPFLRAMLSRISESTRPQGPRLLTQRRLFV
jgi:NTE family protein